MKIEDKQEEVTKEGTAGRTTAKTSKTIEVEKGKDSVSKDSVTKELEELRKFKAEVEAERSKSTSSAPKSVSVSNSFFSITETIDKSRGQGQKKYDKDVQDMLDLGVALHQYWTKEDR